MRSKLIVSLGLLLILSAVAPAWAGVVDSTYTFNYNNECYLTANKPYSTCFPGATGNPPSAGLYEETQTAAGGGIVITRIAGNSVFTYQWAQDTHTSVELTPQNGWSETDYTNAPVGFLFNENSGGSVPYIQLATGCTNYFT